MATIGSQPTLRRRPEVHKPAAVLVFIRSCLGSGFMNSVHLGKAKRLGVRPKVEITWKGKRVLGILVLGAFV
jgi:hypothetical protein